MKKSLFVIIISLISLMFLESCSHEAKLDVDYSFETAINVKEDSKNFNQIKFTPEQNLDLGFYEGCVWIKLEITNQDKYESFIVMTNDLINRNYRFYKLNPIENVILPISENNDHSIQDDRSFNNPKPNFKIDLTPNEKATYFISTASDGRILQATPRLLTLDEYRAVLDRSNLFNIIFFAAIGMLILINIFLWSVLKNKLYYFYSFYIFSSCLFYLNVEGYLYGHGFSHQAIDHFMFLSIRIWIFSVILFTSVFLEINLTNPRFFTFLKRCFFVILGSITFYQFIFYNSSIQHLHKLENLFGFIWIVLAAVMIRISFKKRRVHAKYYLIAFSFLILFVVLGLIDSHTTMLPGDPFSYFKIGTLIELIGFTYFIARIIRINLNKIEDLEGKLDNMASKQVIEKTDLLGIFKLLETSVSSEEEWAEFKSRFEQLSPNFLSNIKRQHPDLSKSEIRLLLLIHIGFSQKEIALTLNIAPDSAKKARQRVRKKLNLDRTMTLGDHLSTFN